jgi:glycerophosphoryl diester phosphodiesterase
MLRRVSPLIGGLCGVCLLGCSSANEDEPAKPNRLLSNEILSIAHGGAAISAPKQTMLSYQQAAEAEADVLEVDIHSSADGVLVVIHDDTVDATTDGTGKVNAKTFEELRKLDAGYAFTTDGGTSFPYRGQGLVIPSLEELFDAFPDAYWVVEIKQANPPVIAPLIEMLREKKVDRRVIVATFIDSVIVDFRAQAPDVFTSITLAEGAPLIDMSPEEEETWSSPAQFVQPPFELATQARVDLVHRLGMKMHPWTVNDPKVMQELIARGVDGIITDDPATLESLLAGQ